MNVFVLDKKQGGRGKIRKETDVSKQPVCPGKTLWHHLWKSDTE